MLHCNNWYSVVCILVVWTQILNFPTGSFFFSIHTEMDDLVTLQDPISGLWQSWLIQLFHLETSATEKKAIHGVLDNASKGS